MDEFVQVSLTVNGRPCEAMVEPRRLLADFLRENLGFTGTHIGCEHGICGSCTVLLDGASVRSCLMFAVQAEGAHVETVEGLAAPNGSLHPIQEAFWEGHGLQCGFCTPGILMTVKELLAENSSPTEEEVRIRLAGNLCRCTGYQHIVESVLEAAHKLRE